MCGNILVHRSMLNHILSHSQWKVINGKEPREDGGGGRPSEIKFRQGNIARAFHFLHRVEGQEEFGQELGLEKLNKHYADSVFQAILSKNKRGNIRIEHSPMKLVWDTRAHERLRYSKSLEQMEDQGR